MQIKSAIFKYRKIIAGIFGSVILIILISFIFFSALQSSRIFENLLHDVYKIELDLLTLCDSTSVNSSKTMDRIYAVDLINMLDRGIFQYKMVLSAPGKTAVDSFYYLIKNKLIQSTGSIVFTNEEYNIMQHSIIQSRKHILESSSELKRALSIFFTLLLIIVAILHLLLITATIRFDIEKRRHQYQLELAKNISESENRIHNLLSSELHDDIGQMLVFLKLKLIENNSILSKEVDPIIDGVRNLSHNLKIPEFTAGNFTSSLEELFSQFSAVSRIRVEYTLSDFHNVLYPDYYPIIIFRVIQEFLQNALKHSNAENIRINMVESAPFLILRYKDDGIGMDSNSTVLGSVEDRAQLLNADLRIDTGADKGLQIVMKIPFVKEED